jgi:nucleotide-binding universal stress UspA family protein
MIKDILLRLEDDDADGEKLTAAAEIAYLFGARITGLFLNVLPAIAPEFGEPTPEALRLAREAGNAVEKQLIIKLAEFGIPTPTEIRRLDVFSEEITDVLARQCRTTDVYVSQAPECNSELRSLIEDLLFQSPRHMLLVPKTGWTKSAISRIVIGWNETREAARAVSEALPYLYKARVVTIVVVVDAMPVDEDALIGRDLKGHLYHHGIDAILRHLVRKDGTVADNLIRESQRREAGLIVIGGYHRSPLRERLLGGTTRSLLDHCPLPLLIAH